jgi:hypothetical protein
MICGHCGFRYSGRAERCPKCGESTTGSGSGLFQTSTVLISAGGSDAVYKSVDEVPAVLRDQLLRSTNGANSATILIADRRGREEISKAIRTLPAPMQRRFMRAVEGTGTSGWKGSLTPRMKAVLFALLGSLTAGLVSLFFWRF